MSAIGKRPVAKTVTLTLQYPVLTVKVLQQVAQYIRDQHGIAVEDSTIADDIARQIEAQINPQPQVYEHLVLQQRGKTVESVCGKAWIPTSAVTVVGKCRDCTAVANRWQA